MVYFAEGHRVVEKRQNFFDNVIDLQNFLMYVGTPCKTEEPMGYGLASLDTLVDDLQTTLNRFLVFKISGGHEQEVFYQTRLLVNDGQRVIDLVSDACGQSPDRGKLVRMFGLAQHGQLRFLGFVNEAR